MNQDHRDAVWSALIEVWDYHVACDGDTSDRRMG
jgi:hypothetical protein